MTERAYDLAIIGGGMGGAAVATVMARAGYRVIVLEKEATFRDRVRGEGMHAWGVPEAKRLGIYEHLLDAGAIEAPKWDIRLGAEPLVVRDFTATTSHGSPLLAFYHPHMQAALLMGAEQAGADVLRGAAVRNVRTGVCPGASVEHGGRMRELKARLVVAADGRDSPTRKWAGFAVAADAGEYLFTGVLLEGVPQPGHTWLAALNPGNGQEAALSNVGDGRVRAYLGHARSAGLKLAKREHLPGFIAACVRTGLPAELYAEARAVGPLASFACADTWVDHPYRDGVALVGDAASTCDPTFGQGMAMTLRSARRLTEHLRANDDWVAAGHAYARDQHADFAAVHRLEGWFRELLLAQGPVADARRAHALPLIVDDFSRMPDLFGMGPDAPSDDLAHRRFFGEQ